MDIKFTYEKPLTLPRKVAACAYIGYESVNIFMGENAAPGNGHARGNGNWVEDLRDFARNGERRVQKGYNGDAQQSGYGTRWTKSRP